MRPEPAQTLHSLTASPSSLVRHYRRFRVDERILLTGHSHQAWPDRAAAGQLAAFDDAAERVDDKWERAFARAERVRAGFGQLMEVRGEELALGANTHELALRFLSALPLERRPRLVTTDGEFHTLRRQLERIRESGWLEVVRLPAHPVGDLSARLAAAVDERTAAVLVSAVLFQTAEIVPGLGELASACRRHGAELLVDAYHALGVMPFPVQALGLGDAFVTGGGYKYCQLGEGNCFLRVPPGRDLRPVITGWFAEFATLEDPLRSGEVPYGGGASAFAGATYDPVSHYRAAEVFAFFEEQRLAPTLLRAVSQHQIALLARGFDALDLDPEELARDRATRLEALGGFLALRAPRAAELCAGLRERGVFADHRDGRLRLGPAPYVSDEQLRGALAALAEAARTRP